MRVIDHRYDRDLLKHDLALRMIRHEARTCTIRVCTGLTDDRIRKLYRSYVSAVPEGAGLRRKRGKSPRQPAFFMRNAPTQLEASLLAGIFAAFDLLHSSPDGASAQRNLEFGELFCDAFETYRAFWNEACLSFEHAWFLWLALSNGEELRIERCPGCSGAYVRDTFAVSLRQCPLCRIRHRVIKQPHAAATMDPCQATPTSMPARTSTGSRIDARKPAG